LLKKLNGGGGGGRRAAAAARPSASAAVRAAVEAAGDATRARGGAASREHGAALRRLTAYAPPSPIGPHVTLPVRRARRASGQWATLAVVAGFNRKGVMVAHMPACAWMR
jgi:hypothetical protein